MTTSPASRGVPLHPPSQGLPEKDTAPEAHSARFDVLRVSACLAVILLHLSATIVLDRELIWSAGWYISVMADAATRWCVVGFIMLSGELLLSPEKHAHPNEFWAKRLHRLLPALIAWSTIYLAWRYLFWEEPLTPALIMHDLLAWRPYIHLHFLFLIAGLYLVTPLLATIVSRLPLPRFYRHLDKGENGEIGGHYGSGEPTSVYRGIST